MTRRSFALDTIQPEAHVFLNPDDAAAMGVATATSCGSRSRRGLDRAVGARVSHRDTPGTCFIPFHFREAAANVLTIDEIDPTGKIPEFKFCAVKRGAGWRQPAAPGAEARAGRFPGPSLIPDLHAIQREHGWLPREELVTLARDRRRPLYEIEGLISFYPHFRTAPPRELPRWPAATTWPAGCGARTSGSRRWRSCDADPSIELREVSCIGRCDMRAGRLHRGRAAPQRRAAAQRSLRPRCARLPRAARGVAGDATWPSWSELLKESGLRGMGGAGFPTGTKWELVAKQEATPKYAICNADESEPGTFKDRQILAEQPHLVLEGLVLGMVATGCHGGLGVHPARVRAGGGRAARGARAPARARACSTRRGVTVDIFTSPGGYILGEESALIECMEGHRGEPRNKPPFPGVAGLWGKPTLMNSVETFAHVPVIAERGADWWKSQGVNGGTGLKFFAVSGHIEKPDVYCVPMGTTRASCSSWRAA